MIQGCGSTGLKQLNINQIVLKPSLLTIFDYQINSDEPADYPCCYSGGNNCTQIKIIEDAAYCCPPNDDGEYEKINVLESAQGYECQPERGFSCKTVEWRVRVCTAPNGDEYACGVDPIDHPCGYTPACTPTGHGEGAEGYEYECADRVNNDCDNQVDCQEARCRATDYCSTACDRDGDGVNNPSCGGPDCDEISINRSQIPLKDLDGNFLPEANELDCRDGRDNDCDGTADWNGANGLPPEPDCPAPTPTPTPTPTSCSSEFGICDDPGLYWDFCLQCCVSTMTGQCQGSSPIVIDIAGDGFNLTNAVEGVRFNIDGQALQEQIAWTTENSDDSWLALDRNSNGFIDNGKELFGNFTPQPTTAFEEKNGFLALAVYDKPENGGNNDNQINSQDSILAQLKLWRDMNHNGISEAGELQNLSDSPIRTIELNYHTSRRTDEHGNRFRYRAKVKDIHGAQVGRWAWDVFLVTAAR